MVHPKLTCKTSPRSTLLVKPAQFSNKVIRKALSMSLSRLAREELCVNHIFRSRYILQVAQATIPPIAISVINFLTVRARTNEREQHQTVYIDRKKPPISTENNTLVSQSNIPNEDVIFPSNVCVKSPHPSMITSFVKPFKTWNWFPNLPHKKGF